MYCLEHVYLVVIVNTYIEGKASCLGTYKVRGSLPFSIKHLKLQSMDFKRLHTTFTNIFMNKFTYLHNIYI